MTRTAVMRIWIADNRKEMERFLKFVVVGTSGAAVDFGILYLLHIRLGLDLILANTISFICALLNNFTWNRYWIYPESRSKPVTAQLWQFFIVNIAGWAINTGILWALNQPLAALAGDLGLAVTSEQAHTVGYNAAKVVATGIVLFWNFFINRYWTYSDVE